jgi:hypothetical protein
MPRTIASSLLQNMLSPSPTDGIRWLLELDWNDGVNVGNAKLALHDQNVISGGNTYTASAFGIGLPDEDGQSDVSMLRLVVQDPDFAVRRELRKLDPRYPATVTLRQMLISDPNTQALAPYSGPLRNVKIGRVALAASVETFRNMAREAAVQYNMTPAHGFNSLRSR